jgi:alkylhydroperoxidase family enzyme
MARIAGVNPENPPVEVREIFAEQIHRQGFVSNTALVYGLRPTIYKGVQALNEGLRASGLIAPELRHMVCVKAASINGCPF